MRWWVAFMVLMLFLDAIVKAERLMKQDFIRSAASYYGDVWMNIVVAAIGLALLVYGWNK